MSGWEIAILMGACMLMVCPSVAMVAYAMGRWRGEHETADYLASYDNDVYLRMAMKHMKEAKEAKR